MNYESNTKAKFFRSKKTVLFSLKSLKRERTVVLDMVSNCSTEDCIEDNNTPEKIVIFGNNINKLPKNLSYRDLRNVMLPLNLTHFDLEGCNFTEVKFQERTLPNVIRHANFNNANLQYIKNISIDLSYSNLTSTKLPKDLSKWNLTGVVLDYLDLSDHILPSKLRSASLIGAKLPIDIRHVNLIGADLTNVDLSQSLLPNDLSFANLENTKLPEEMDGIVFKGTIYDVSS